MLEDLGHVVLEANSAAEALTFFEGSYSIDLVITDHAMPEMTGMQLAQRLGEIRPQLQVILATGYADLPQTPGSFIDLPRLSKPFVQNDLVRMISQCTVGVTVEDRARRLRV